MGVEPVGVGLHVQAPRWPTVTQLTTRQLDVLRAIWHLTKRNGFPPTMREVCRHVGVKGTNTLTAGDRSGHIDKLRRKGCLRVKPWGCVRGLILSSYGRFVLGKFHLGEDGKATWPQRMFTEKGTVLVRVDYP